jgi:hypothetical protein
MDPLSNLLLGIQQNTQINGSRFVSITNCILASDVKELIVCLVLTFLDWTKNDP